MKLHPRLYRFAAVFVALVTMTALPFAATAAQFLTGDQPFVMKVERHADGDLVIRWTIADGHYLYRDHTAAKAGAETLPVRLSAGVEKDDPGFGKVSVWFANGEAIISAQDLARAGDPATLKVTYQGCEDGSICYPPMTQDLRVPERVAASLSGPQARETPSAQSTLAEPSMVADDPEVSGKAEPAPITSMPVSPAVGELPEQKPQTLIDSLASQGGKIWVLLAFLGFGLLLAFTPCVFPMYPILAGVIGQDASGTRRGFLLSSAYVLGLALAFAGLGFVAAWSGQNLQMALQSPWVIGTFAIVFLVLAASMFGGFDLTLPRWWTERFGGTTKTGRRSLLSAGGMGFASALIVGPCVTAPLAGALLYIAQTGDVVLGAAALFSLGMGKGIPLVLFGTAGARFLPRAGAWMNQVKAAFGFVFVVMAWWLLSRILPTTIVMMSGALVALAIAVSLWRLSQTSMLALAIVSKTMALALGLWGAFWLGGVALGSTEIWQPLSGTASATTSIQQSTSRVAAVVSDASALEAALERTAAQNKTAVVYFTADWCVTCRTIERDVLTDAGVIQAFEEADLIKVDVTSNSDAVRELMARYDIVGPPTVLFVGPDGQEIVNTRLVGKVTTSAVLDGVAQAGSAKR